MGLSIKNGKISGSPAKKPSSKKPTRTVTTPSGKHIDLSKIWIIVNPDGGLMDSYGFFTEREAQARAKRICKEDGYDSDDLEVDTVESVVEGN